MRPNEILTFATKPKQMTFGFWFIGPNQIRQNEMLPFGIKPKQISFGKTECWISNFTCINDLYKIFPDVFY